MSKSNSEVTAKENIGVVSGCDKLNVRSGPSTNSDSITVIPEGTKVIVDLDFGKNMPKPDFYKVCLASGVEGFCMCKYIQIRQGGKN